MYPGNTISTKRILVILLLFTSFLWGIVPVHAKHTEKHCKAIVHANRHKAIAFADIQLDDSITRFTTSDGITITAYNHDSVTAEKDGKIFSGFRIKQHEVIAPAILYYKNDMKFLDSLDPKRPGYINDYFGIYRSSHVFMTQDYTQNSKLYYNRNGADSFMIISYINCIPQKMIWYKNGDVDVVMEWNENGILSAKKTLQGTTLYYPDGIIQSSALDTIISKHSITCRKEYFSNGVIKSIQFFQDSLPCHVWESYSDQGALVKTIKKTPVSDLPDKPKVVEAPAPSEIFTYVEQMAEYPGGMRAFETYLNEHLPDALCQCKKVLKGRYKIRLNINGNGDPSIVHIDGQNAAAFQRVFPVLQKWKPAKMQGRPVSVIYVVNVMVK